MVSLNPSAATTAWALLGHTTWRRVLAPASLTFLGFFSVVLRQKDKSVVPSPPPPAMDCEKSVPVGGLAQGLAQGARQVLAAIKYCQRGGPVGVFSCDPSCPKMQSGVSPLNSVGPMKPFTPSIPNQFLFLFSFFK